MTKKGVGFVKGSPFYEVDLLKNDSHEAVISKIANALALSNSTDSALLMTSGGCIIKDDMIDAGGKVQSWTLAAYLTKRHIAPEKLTLGIAIEEACTRGARGQKVSQLNFSDLDLFLTAAIKNDTINSELEGRINDDIQGETDSELGATAITNARKFNGNIEGKLLTAVVLLLCQN